MGVVIQSLVAADVAGVLFTCNPVTGQDELVVEASWGLGEAVVQGLVIPDSCRMDRSGRLLESRAGFKDVSVQRVPGGLTRTETVAAHLVEQFCLDAKNWSSYTRLWRSARVFSVPDPMTSNGHLKARHFTCCNYAQ